MEKKSVSATILVLFLAMTFSIIGICFSVFVYMETKIIVNNVKIEANSVSVCYDKELNNEATKLELSNMDLGLKPATGELDTETQVPSTITDKETSEGYFATVYISPVNSLKIKVKNIQIESKGNANEIKEERKNIFIAIKDIKQSIKSLEDDEIELVTLQNVNEVRKLTFFIWLGSFADEKLIGAKINFTISFE